MGDPCGIGPEIVARLFADESTDTQGLLVLGDAAVMRRALAHCGLHLPVAELDQPADLAEAPPHCLPVWAPPGLSDGLAQRPMGQVCVDAGRAAALCIEAAAMLARRGEVDALVTAPIHKEALAAAGVPYPGHTEMLQALAADGAALPPVRMMLANDELRVVLVTIHLALRQAIAMISVDSVLQTLRIAHAAAAAWGQARPRIAVPG